MGELSSAVPMFCQLLQFLVVLLRKVCCILHKPWAHALHQHLTQVLEGHFEFSRDGGFRGHVMPDDRQYQPVHQLWLLLVNFGG